jgi:hypothetical protein
MNPIAADTDSAISVSHRATMPPIIASGMLAMINEALAIDPKALKSSKKISRIDSGTTQDSLAMARCWFSNSPDQAML